MEESGALKEYESERKTKALRKTWSQNLFVYYISPHRTRM